MKSILAIAFIASISSVAHSVDFDEPSYPPPPSYAYPPPPPAYAYRPPGTPPGVVFYAPSTGRCLPGFFWRVYLDGSGECWPWQ